MPDLSSKFSGYHGIDLSFNCFERSIPLVPLLTTSLVLSNNMFSGSISLFCSVLGQNFRYLDLSNNNLSGEIPDCKGQWHFTF